MAKLDKYIELAKELKMLHAQLLTPQDVVFDIRALLKCRWGCHQTFQGLG